MYITDCCFGLNPNCSLITSAIFVPQSTCGSTIGICCGEAVLAVWLSSQAVVVYASSIVQLIAPEVFAGTSDWVSVESSSVVELMD